jgi:Domain of unknown function (DUF4169)
VADMVNLRRARKAQERIRRQAAAAEARIKHGRTATQRALADDERERDKVRLDGHEIDRSDKGRL